jgi:integrase
MNDEPLLGPWVRRFLLEHLVAERNLARNTQRSYRDALTLLIPFAAAQLHQTVDRLQVVDVSADLVRLFLADLEQTRQCAITTRNQRLAAVHALARFVGEHSPEHIAWCGQIRSIPFKKASKAVVPYLDKPQMDALMAAPDRQTAQGRRDHALLLFLYNSGTRAAEAAQLLVGELALAGGSVKIRGKGGKAPLPIVAVHRCGTHVSHRRPLSHGTCFSQSLRSSDYALWHPHARRTVRTQGPNPDALNGYQTDQPSHHPPHDGDPPAPRRCRHQHRSRLAWARVAGHNQHLRGNRPGDESQSSRQV